MTPPQAAPVPIDGRVAADAARVLAEFLKPFSGADEKVKPAMIKNNRALALHYIDARAVMDRLDAVVFADGWQDAYTVLDNGSVECRLSVLIGDRWITKADVGSVSEQPDDGDRMKAAYSDAFKRAAVKFGIGRYLYRLPSQWLDYDPVKKCIVRPDAGQPKPAQQPAAKPLPVNARPSTPAAVVSDSAKEIAALFDAAKTRADGIPPYKRFEAAQTAGHVTPADKAHIDAALARFNQRLPRPQPAGAR